MSRTREGRDKESNQVEHQQAESQPMRERADQSSASRPTTYTPGRESMREFPRRSTSLRERDISESRNLYDRDYPRESRSYDRGSFREERPRGDFDDRRRYGRSDLGWGRTFEDYSYDRARRGQRSPREDYDEPYHRETPRGRSGQQQWPARRGQYLYPGETDFRTEEMRERRETYYGRNYLRCQDIMTRDVTTCSPQTSIREIAEKMQDDNVGSIPVVDNGRLIGIVTDRDIVCRVLSEGRDTRAATAADAMSEDIVTCTPEESVLDAIRKMGEHQVRRVPVCDVNGRLRGIIALADVALEAERDSELAEALEDISQPLPNRSRRV